MSGPGTTRISQCDRILALLADGSEHEMRAIHNAIGFCRLNSRVAELRSRGHNIVCRKQNGEYHYRLVTLEEGADERPLPAALSSSDAGQSSVPVECQPASLQLELAGV